MLLSSPFSKEISVCTFFSPKYFDVISSTWWPLDLLVLMTKGKGDGEKATG